ncbi:MAG: hypothetical protein Q9217_003934 [Psora testacea]
MFGAARKFANFHILNCLSDDEPRPPSRDCSYSPRDDINLSNAEQEGTDISTKRSRNLTSIIDKPTHSGSSATEGTPSRDRPTFTEGLVKFVVAKDDDAKDCLALLVTERMIQVINNIAEDDRKREAAETALQSLEAEEFKLQRLIGKSDTTFRSIACQEHGLEESENTSRLQSKLESLGEEKGVLQMRIEIFERNATFGQTKVQHMLEKAMDQVNLLKKAVIQPSELSVEDQCDENDDEAERKDMKFSASTEIAIEKTAESGVDEEAKVLQAAQREFEDAQTALFRAQCEFDGKENRYQTELAEFEMAIEVGDTEWTRSQFDRRAVMIGQYLTGVLIDAENDYDRAHDRAQKMGVFDDGWGQSSYYGHSQYTEQSLRDGQVLDGGFSSALSAVTREFIASWTAGVDATDHEEKPARVEVDEWASRPVDQSDSISAIESGPLKRRINNWQWWCDEHRQEWQPEQARVKDLWDIDGRVTSRRNSWSL